MRRQRLRAALNAMPDSGSTARLQSSKSKRTNHGGVAWSVPVAENRLKQPQDGASKRAFDAAAEEEADANSWLARPSANEPEDAQITGGTRSLMRRVMGLNVTTGPDTRKPARGVGGTIQTRVA